ncbi:halocyanin domain-containing protein [Halohasta litorea]|uniref:Halocyanin domain-containing protein n=1 Tax=Halohasta litorea TaxID=869891 RepID=A0ABD6D7V5_9EURY|nr:halocyanin domain-containing protein [Halohasta litorea]
MTGDHAQPPISRRTVLRTGAAIGTASLGLTTAGVTAAQNEVQEPDYGDWFGNVGNYDSTVDERGSDEVTITVGSSANGGAYGFDPAAIHVDPGTTIVWEWSGDGGSHNVVAEDGSFESELTEEAGHTFEYTVEAEGIITYACSPHKSLGMKGTIAVGDVETVTVETASEGESEADDSEDGIDYDGWFENVDNFEETVDERGSDEVTITVGADGNKGHYAFDPPAVRVDPGTTIVWEWASDGPSYNVVENEGRFASDLTGEGGHTFEQTVEDRGIVKYVCSLYERMGMRGAVVVGSPDADGGYSRSDLLTLGGGLGLVGALVSVFAAGTTSKSGQSAESGR